MDTVLVSYPATLAVSVADLKSHLRIDASTEDSLLTSYIQTATKYAEEYCGRQFITASFKAYLDCWQTGKLYLDWPPLVSVTSVKYIDNNGAEQTWDASNYQVVTSAHRGYIYSTDSPPHRTQPQAAYIAYNAGYGSAASSLPFQAIHAIKLLAGNYYENREATAAGQMVEVPFAVTALLDQLAVMEIV
jgi:uncharacterized phiE125 gp8 family phage protein